MPWIRGLVCLLLLGLPGFAAADEIVWSAARPLDWNDFRGRVPGGTDAENVAATAASLGWTYEYEFERSASGCRYHVTAIRATAIFHSESSWVKPGHETAAVLEHEQGHFDLTQVSRLMFEAQTRALVGMRGTCAGRNANRTSKRIAAEITARIEPIYEQIWQSHLALQERYDRDTRHGIATDTQRNWNRSIAAGLRGQGWEQLQP